VRRGERRDAVVAEEIDDLGHWRTVGWISVRQEAGAISW
jgi:hypothetical protein